MKNKKTTRIICEGAILIAAALVLSYIDIPTGIMFGGFGGSIDFVMVPLIVFAVMNGIGWGIGAGLIFGTLKFFLAGGVAVNWQSMLLDYSLAYMAVGFAGTMKRNHRWAVGATIGSFVRFIVHFISGITIYAQYMPEDFLGMTMTTPWQYSLLYNGTYMLPNAIIAIIICAALKKPLNKLAER